MKTFKQYLKESPRFDDFHKGLGGPDEKKYFLKDYSHVRNHPEYKKIIEEKFKGLTIFGYASERSQLVYLFAFVGAYYKDDEDHPDGDDYFDHDDIAGSIQAEFKPVTMHVWCPKVIKMGVFEKYRNKGLATKMYTILIEKYDALMSDNELSGEEGHGSFQIWEKLGTMYPYKYIKNYQGKELHQVDGFDRTYMKPSLPEVNTPEVFVVSKIPLHKDLNQGDI